MWFWVTGVNNLEIDNLPIYCTLSFSGPSANYFFSFLTAFFDLSKHAPVFSAVTIFHIFSLIGEPSWRCGEDRAPPSSCSARIPAIQIALVNKREGISGYSTLQLER